MRDPCSSLRPPALTCFFGRVCRAQLVKQMSTRCVEWSSVLEVMRTRLERLWIGTGAAMLQREKENEQLAAERARQTMLAAEEESAEEFELKAEVAMLRGKLAVAETRLATAARARLAASSGENSDTEAVAEAASGASSAGASPEHHATPTSLDSFVVVSPPASLEPSPPSVRSSSATSASAAASDIVQAATTAAVRSATSSPPAAITSSTGHSARVQITVSQEGEMILSSCRVVIEASG